MMFSPKGGFSGFSVDNLGKAKEFYSQTLGLTVTDEGAGIGIHVPDGPTVFCYPKGPGHKPATYTILNLEVDSVEEAVAELTGRGVHFQRYPGNTYQDEKGIQRGQGPTIAWFTDPAGNILSVIEQ